MKLLDIFKRKKNAELECLRDAYNTLDKQLQFMTRENENHCVRLKTAYRNK